MWVGLIKSVKGLDRKKTKLPRGRRNSASKTAFRLRQQYLLFPDTSLSAYYADLDLHNHVNQFAKKITLSLSLHTHTHTHTQHWFYFNGEP